MFEEIIEILDEAKNNNCFTKLEESYDKGLDYAIKILEKEAEKTFNPEDFGFDIYTPEDGSYSIKWRLYGNHLTQHYTLSLYEDTNQYDLEYLDELHCSSDDYNEMIPEQKFNDLKIPTHLFGKQLLENMGVINNV